MTDVPVIARIRAVDDGGNALAPIHDRHGMRQVDRVVAVPPGIKWIAVSGDAADHPFRFGALRGGESAGSSNPGSGCVVENELGQAAGAADDGNSPAARPPPALADRQHFGQLVEIAHLDGAVRAQNFREHARRARKPTGMANDGALRALAASNFQHHHRAGPPRPPDRARRRSVPARAPFLAKVAMTAVAGSLMRYSM